MADWGDGHGDAVSVRNVLHDGRPVPLMDEEVFQRLMDSLDRAVAAEGPDLADPCGLCFHERADHPQDDKKWHPRAGWHDWAPMDLEVHGG